VISVIPGENEHDHPIVSKLHLLAQMQRYDEYRAID
jgi:hypothetical protein